MSEKGPVELPAAAATRLLNGNANSTSEARHERRVLTALCYDLVGSTELLGVLGIEDFEELILAFQLAAKSDSILLRHRECRGRRRRLRCSQSI